MRELGEHRVVDLVYPGYLVAVLDELFLKILVHVQVVVEHSTHQETLLSVLHLEQRRAIPPARVDDH